MNLNFLKAKISENELTRKDIAKKIKMSPKILNSKLNGKEKMTLLDFHKIVNTLELNDQDLEIMIHEMFKARRIKQKSEV
jgi:hypothetical protein